MNLNYTRFKKTFIEIGYHKINTPITMPNVLAAFCSRENLLSFLASVRPFTLFAIELDFFGVLKVFRYELKKNSNLI